MGTLIPFHFENFQIRVVTGKSGEPLFVGKDICDALRYARPSDAMQQHCKGASIYRPLQTPGGLQEMRVLSEPDVLRLIVNCTLPAAQAFERLVFEEILPTIRKTGSYTVPSKRPVETATEALKLTPLAVKAARAFGLDKNAAAISANQFVQKLTGVNLLENFGHTHLEAENQDALYLSATELGKRMGISAQKANLLLAGAGFQMKRGDVWEVLEAGKDFARIFDTGKRHGSGVPIQQIKWSTTVLPLLKPVAEEA
jgi:prophage antirepressor-like protein